MTIAQIAQKKSKEKAERVYLDIATKNTARWYQYPGGKRRSQHYFGIEKKTDWTIVGIFGTIIFLLFVIWTSAQIEMWMDRTIKNANIPMEERR